MVINKPLYLFVLESMKNSKIIIEERLKKGFKKLFYTDFNNPLLLNVI